MQNLKKALSLGMLCPIYLFYGNESMLMEEYIEKIAALVCPEAREWDQELFQGDETEISQILLSANSSGLFSQRKLIVVRNAPGFQTKKRGNSEEQPESSGENKAAAEALIAYAQDPNPDVVLILCSPSANKNSRLLKAIAAAGRVVEFSSPRGPERERWLSNYLKKAGKLPQAGLCSYVSLMAGEGLSSLRSEADKLILYCEKKTEISLADAEAIVSHSSLAGIFELTDAAAQRDGERSILLLRRLLQQGEPPYNLLALLAGQYRNMLAVWDLRRRGFSQAEIPGCLGLHPYVVKKCWQAGNKYSGRQLLSALEALLEAELSGKSGMGKIEALLEVALLRICAI
ncbi:MAG: DNA polymerase III subunit delta [Bacillota bacterium]|nr:DNA polymerase III subunit delta [Bacillota bacterium]